MKTFLFQGDSITDADRNRSNDHHFGTGYPNIVAGRIEKNHPGEITCVNKGVSGDRSVDMLARINRDLLYYKPDYLSVLIGVNDVWHELGEKPNGITADDYEEYLDMFVRKVLKALPNIKIFILEPFVLKGFATVDENNPHRWEYFSTEVPKRAERAKKIAEKYGLCWIPLQDKFNEVSNNSDPSIWLADGVHPAPAGHTLIADQLLAATGL